MPYYRERLLSYWPSTICEVGQLPPQIEPEVAANFKPGEIGFYAPNPRKLLRNQIIYTRIESQATKTIAPPKFLSEKAREMSHIQEDDRGFTDALVDLKLDAVAKKDIPHIYRNVEIKYSKFGVDDFDFESVSPNAVAAGSLLTHVLQILQQDGLLWFGDTYCKLVCKPSTATLQIHANPEESCLVPHLYSLLAERLYAL
jgi:PAB-dependent poly(A)-specific ribonuclease subunit 2